MEDEKMELSHAPVPGYRTIFYMVFAVSVAYLTLIFVRTM
jgi:hypothetical protein